MNSSVENLECSVCKENLPLEAFAKNNKSKRKYQYSCKTCYSITHKVYRQRPGFKEARLLYQQEWTQNNQGLMRSWQLKKYGITQQQYEEMLVQQDYSCKICSIHIDDAPQKETRKMKYKLHIDHCHTTGKVRGLLCFSCNSALGHFKDSVDLLQKSIAYLKESSDGSS